MSSTSSLLMMMATFNPESRLKPNNLAEIEDSWNELLKMEWRLHFKQ